MVTHQHNLRASVLATPNGSREAGLIMGACSLGRSFVGGSFAPAPKLDRNVSGLPQEALT